MSDEAASDDDHPERVGRDGLPDSWWYREQLENLVAIVDEGGRSLRNQAALVSEHGGDADDLRTIIAGAGKLGDAMVGAAERTRALIEERDSEDG